MDGAVAGNKIFDTIKDVGVYGNDKFLYSMRNINALKPHQFLGCSISLNPCDYKINSLIVARKRTPQIKNPIATTLEMVQDWGFQKPVANNNDGKGAYFFNLKMRTSQEGKPP